MDFKTVYETHKILVYNLALKYAGNKEDAEEIFQDVFIKIYHHISSFREDSALQTWIYRICINTSIDFIRMRNRRRNLQILSFSKAEKEIFCIADFHFHPETQLLQKEKFSRLMQAIHRLPENQKTCIILLKLENKSQKECAEIMNLSIKAIEGLYQRAKNNIKKIWNNTEGI